MAGIESAAVGRGFWILLGVTALVIMTVGLTLALRAADDGRPEVVPCDRLEPNPDDRTLRCVYD